MKEIILTRGKVALVDDADFDRVNKFKWFAGSTRGNVWYALRTVWHPKTKKRQTVHLHKFLTGFKHTDHEDGNGLNCQRYNLRPATNQQNLQAKRTKKKNTTSKYRGVSWQTDRQKWLAGICAEGKKRNLGRFETEMEAAKAYDAAARKYFGEFASPNFTN